VRWVPGLSRG